MKKTETLPDPERRKKKVKLERKPMMKAKKLRKKKMSLPRPFLWRTISRSTTLVKMLLLKKIMP